MCGITGYVSKKPYTNCSTLKDMVDAIIHRGPNDKGLWHSDDYKVGMGHTRLSVIDLSPAGHQPMHSLSKKFTIVFNGEIYNHKTIRRELSKNFFCKWNGSSDTEVLLMAIEHWGVEKALKKAVGMFAFAIWNRQNQTLTIARDRMGEKPVYYGWAGGNFVFSSELSSLRKFPDFNNEIDRNSLSKFLRYGSINAPYSIYKNIYKLEPGSYLVKDRKDNLTINKYWSIEENIRDRSMFHGTKTQAVDELESVLSNAIDLQMTADVPLGSFLSGGIDSSLVSAIMQSKSNKKINTFSIGFDNKSYNEAEHARLVANHLGTNHYDLYVSNSDVLNVVPLLPKIYDEPFSDSSQIPTYLISMIAKDKVTVSLSGDGADELFGGYNRYTITDKMWGGISKTPVWTRSLVRDVIRKVDPRFFNLILGRMFRHKYQNIGDKIHKGAEILPSKNIEELYIGLTSQIRDPDNWVLGGLEYKDKEILYGENTIFKDLSFIEKLMAYDMTTYLPSDILTKVDRAAMSVSLETRSPFLDHRVVEFSMSLPLSYKINNGVSKWVLRELLYKYVPKELINRPKMGFSVPLDEWLSGPLREWAESLISIERLSNEGYLNPILVRSKWDEHISGKRNWKYQLWNVLMFQSWLESIEK